VFIYDLVSGEKTMLPFIIDAYSDNAVDWGILSAGDLGL